MGDAAERDAQGEVIAFLSEPRSYGVTGPVERIDTHAAIVFLAGERAYKLKRAVKYPYLDFSTRAQRRAVCETELALNRRTAPELYLEVRSVNRQADGALGFGEGEPVDWLVVMRRFASECLLERIAGRGELYPPLLRALADAIAAFHGSADVVTGPDGADRVRHVIEGNRDAMGALDPGALPADACAGLTMRSLAELDRLADLLDRRAEAGHVRHCHGDLHLANICLWQGRPVLFDCLEFDERLAISDVLYDLAFLVMDLWERGHRAEASLVLNRYFDRRDEADGVPAMPLFLSMRAAVRAHVGATAATRQSEAAAGAAKLADARAYLDAAVGFLDRQPARLVAIGGLSGTGKSTLAARLAPEIGHAPGARWLRSDVLRKRIAGVAPEERLPPSAYTRERGAEVYARLLADARAMLAAGQSVIVDAVFADPAERAALARLANECNVRFDGLWLEADRATLVARVTARSGDASDADVAVVERQFGYEIGDLSGWTRVMAAGAPTEVVTRARNVLGV